MVTDSATQRYIQCILNPDTQLHLHSYSSELEAEHEDLLAKINITKLKLKDAERSMALKNPLGT